MSSLPAGWITAPLGAFTLDCGQRVPEEFEEFKYIDIGSVNRDTKRIETPQQLLGKNAPSRARKHVKAGDVLISMTRPNLNAVALVPDEMDGQIASTGFDVLRASSGIEHRWVSYLVRTAAFVDAMSELVQGALYPAVRPKDIRGFETPLAPLPEQKRIADKLDAVLARVDACRDRLDRIPAILKRFRQPVLAAATTGKLTEDWRNDTAISMEETWDTKQLKDISTDVSYGYTASSVETPIGPKMLRITDIQNNQVDWGSVPYCEIEKSKKLQYVLKHGDLVFARTGATVGKSFLIWGEIPDAVFASYLIRVRCNESNSIEYTPSLPARFALRRGSNPVDGQVRAVEFFFRVEADAGHSLRHRINRIAAAKRDDDAERRADKL